MSTSVDLPDPCDLAKAWIDDEADVADGSGGKGGHDTTFRICCTLVHGFDLGDADLMSLLEHYNATKCAPPWNHGELMHKLSNARATTSKYPKGWLYRKMLRARGLWSSRPGSGTTRATVAPRYEAKWKLDFNLEALRRVQPGTPWTVERLAAASPVNVETTTTADFLRHVFGMEAMVLIFTVFGSQGQYMWWRGRSYRLANRPGVAAVPAELPKGGPDGVWYLSQPVTGKWEPNPRETDKLGRPKMSRRSEESVRSWEHMVLEADPVDEVKRDPKKMAEFETLWLGFLVQLPLPIKAIYTSAGKSTHALVHLPAANKERFDAMKKMVGPLFSKLGADPRALKAVQLTRLPGCMRGNRLQKLLYLNPSPDPTGITIERGTASV
ncbi:hypothetical protein [Prosthecobacter algae]|uniref:hypothetical protein n=1 Tax=Prosthecobacter algae TaxID=1144682 RepID=UPI0031F0E60D